MLRRRLGSRVLSTVCAVAFSPLALSTSTSAMSSAVFGGHFRASAFSATPLASAQRFCATSAAPSEETGPAGASGSALDVAMRVNKLKRLHQTGQAGRKQLESTAWKELNTLTEDQINTAEGKAVALLLNAWAYFAKFWERGKEGPAGAAAAPAGSAEGQQQQP